MKEAAITLLHRTAAPVELWLFVVGYLGCVAADFVHFSSPFNPILVMPPILGGMTILGREQRTYRVTIGMVGLAVVFPFVQPLIWPTLYETVSIDAQRLLVPQLLLLTLLFSPRVRHFVAQPIRTDEAVRDRCAWCGGTSGRLEEVVVSAPSAEVPASLRVRLHPEHVRSFLHWYPHSHAYRKALRFGSITALGAVTLVSLILAAFGESGAALTAVGVVFALVGAAYVLFPPSDPILVRLIGLRRSLLVGRGCGAGLLFLGVLLVTAALGS